MRGSASVGWAVSPQRGYRGDRGLSSSRRLTPKTNSRIVPDLSFAPEIPEGFVDGDAFLEKFTSRPELKDLMVAARQRLERSRSETKEYKVSLASLRREAGLSQKELADRISTSQPTISMYESGEREPSLKALYSLSEALGVSFDRLLPALKG